MSNVPTKFRLIVDYEIAPGSRASRKSKTEIRSEMRDLAAWFEPSGFEPKRVAIDWKPPKDD